MPLLRITPEKNIEIPCALFVSSTVELLLENVSSHPYVAYKIKTTAPKSYLVRPSSGVVPQGQTRSVQIVLQAPTEDPPRSSSDRFLVQATPVDSALPLPRNQWLSLPKSEVEETRLNVLFKRTGETAAGAGGPRGPSSAAAGVPGGAAGGPQQQHGLMSHEEHAAAAPGGGAPSPHHLLAGGGPGAAAAPDGLSSASHGLPVGAAAAGSSSSSSADLKQQYDQLIDYALAMEQHKEELARENEALKQQLEARSSRGLGELWHLPVYLFVLFMAWYLLDRSFGGGGAAASPPSSP
ncbi:hypothetical protein Efla_001734 [Eimeria flavescens]